MVWQRIYWDCITASPHQMEQLCSSVLEESRTKP
jgi:hypothetical protein